MSDYEKNEAKRKIKEENKQRDLLLRDESRDKPQDETAKKNDNHNNEVDYNALDYEDNEDHQSDDENVNKKQVPSLVQYPLPGSFKPVDGRKETNESQIFEGKMNDQQNTKRSEVLAMALGVQIKTGEDPPTGEIEISGYNKKNKKLEKADVIDKTAEVNARLLKIAGQPENISKEYTEDPKRGDRNKFKIEKPDGSFYEKYKNGRNRDFDRRREYRRPDYRRGDGRRRYEFDRYRRGSRYRSPRRSRSRDRRRSRSRDRSRRSRSKDRKQKSKSHTPDIRKRKHSESSDKSKETDKKAETDVEKFKRRAEQILLLKKKMEFELLEMKKKKEEEEKQLILEEKQRKAKEEAEMLEKAKKAKREALEKEKLLKTVKALKELDKKKSSPYNSSFDSNSSSSSSSSNSSSSRSEQ